ncbi:MAG: AarF/UbiB family protein [Nostocoides sp.]
MSIADLEFRLPDDVDAVAGPDGLDLIVSRRGSRTPPQVLSADAWALLERFRTSMTLTHAVLDHCGAAGTDPVVTLEAAFPVLVALTRSELLVAAGTDAEASLVARHAVDERVGPAILVGQIRVLRDSELWDAVLDDGSRVVVKVVDDAVSGSELFHRETTALHRLTGGPVADLLWQEPRPDGGVLVLRFVAGDPVDLASLDSRGVRNTDAAVRLALATLDAYAAMHARGVLHGDVHPGNVLADERGRVTLIDFGIADVQGSGLGPAPRTGGGEQLDPHAAQALRRGEALPALDVAAEVYALAALTYRILTGSSSLDLDLERDEALDVILTRPPRSFEEVGRPPWPAVEGVLRRGLAKKSADRQASVADLRDDLARAAGPAPAYEQRTRTDHSVDQYLDLGPYDVDGDAWAGADAHRAARTSEMLRAIAVRTGEVEAHDLAGLWAVRLASRTAPESPPR